VEIGTDAAQSLFWEYINPNFFAVQDGGGQLAYSIPVGYIRYTVPCISWIPMGSGEKNSGGGGVGIADKWDRPEAKFMNVQFR
jgi:hypothetical protein